MGGFGSGRYQRGKNTTSDYQQLDVRRLQRDGFLKPGRTFSWQWTCTNGTAASILVKTELDMVTLSYRHKSGDGDWKDECHTVFLDWTPCHFGGQRAWFICPGQRCWRRVAILYGEVIFACRHCHKLAYPCQRETPLDRVARRANRIRRRLGWKEGILNPMDGKPKGMHWKTFERLTHQHNVLLKTSLDGMSRQLSLRD